MYSVLITSSVRDYFTAPYPEGISMLVNDVDELRDIINFCVNNDLEVAIKWVFDGGE